MGDEVLAGAAPLVGMAVAGEGEGTLDGLAVDLVARVLGVLGDDREQVAQQRALVVGEWLGEAVDRRGAVLPVAGADASPAAYFGCLRLLRYCRPSSWRSR
jgi:hypothetical protein